MTTTMMSVRGSECAEVWIRVMLTDRSCAWRLECQEDLAATDVDDWCDVLVLAQQEIDAALTADGRANEIARIRGYDADADASGWRWLTL